MVELAWTWLRWQPDSALAVWFRARVGVMGGRIRKIMIVALARKVLVALWRYVKDGVIPEGAKESSVRRLSFFSPSEGDGWRSPQKTEDPSGRRCADWTRRKELLSRMSGSWFGIV
jgi:hypothetical protein